ncbi:MAG: hypothetical protein IJJ52_05900 [Lachnospiraceae bacterium]|nr:hypothetical protein [Lachnospiraceae bacterium]
MYKGLVIEKKSRTAIEQAEPDRKKRFAMPDTGKRNRKLYLLKWLKVAVGLFVFAFGIHLTIFANIGLAPWDVLGMGIAAHTPLNYGLSMTATSVVILVIVILLGERIGVGTILDAFLTGNYVQLFNDLDPFAKNEGLLTGILIMLVGFVFMAIGMWIYAGAEQGCGPRDSLLVGLGRRMPKVPIGFVEILLWSAVTAVGALLKGPVGIGTLISAGGAGLVMQAVYSVIHFDPRTLRHKDVMETIRLM